MKFELIPMVYATDMPKEVLDYCVENEINTHYDNDVTCVEDDGNPLAEWLKSNGYVFKDKERGDWIAVIGS